MMLEYVACIVRMLNKFSKSVPKKNEGEPVLMFTSSAFLVFVQQGRITRTNGGERQSYVCLQVLGKVKAAAEDIAAYPLGEIALPQDVDFCDYPAEHKKAGLFVMVSATQLAGRLFRLHEDGNWRARSMQYRCRSGSIQVSPDVVTELGVASDFQAGATRESREDVQDELSAAFSALPAAAKPMPKPKPDDALTKGNQSKPSKPTPGALKKVDAAPSASSSSAGGPAVLTPLEPECPAEDEGEDDLVALKKMDAKVSTAADPPAASASSSSAGGPRRTPSGKFYIKEGRDYLSYPDRRKLGHWLPFGNTDSSDAVACGFHKGKCQRSASKNKYHDTEGILVDWLFAGLSLGSAEHKALPRPTADKGVALGRSGGAVAG